MVNKSTMSEPPEHDPPSPSERFDARQSAISLLGAASCAARLVAEHQAGAVEAAGELLERTADCERIVWVTGDAADEHQRRLEAAGHRSICMVDPTRLPPRLHPDDLLFVAAVEEAPTCLIAEAGSRGVRIVLLTANVPFPRSVDVSIVVDHENAQVVELTHDFIVTALCAQAVDWNSSESAA